MKVDMWFLTYCTFIGCSTWCQTYTYYINLCAQIYTKCVGKFCMIFGSHISEKVVEYIESLLAFWTCIYYVIVK